VVIFNHPNSNRNIAFHRLVNYLAANDKHMGAAYSCADISFDGPVFTSSGLVGSFFTGVFTAFYFLARKMPLLFSRPSLKAFISFCANSKTLPFIPAVRRHLYL
jgi:hypothetical protein